VDARESFGLVEGQWNTCSSPVKMADDATNATFSSNSGRKADLANFLPPDFLRSIQSDCFDHASLHPCSKERLCRRAEPHCGDHGSASARCRISVAPRLGHSANSPGTTYPNVLPKVGNVALNQLQPAICCVMNGFALLSVHVFLCSNAVWSSVGLFSDDLRDYAGVNKRVVCSAMSFQGAIKSAVQSAGLVGGCCFGTPFPSVDAGGAWL
jgi:hypothetical protein